MKSLALLFFFPIVAFGSTAEYCLKGELTHLDSGRVTGSMICQVAQKLTWDDSSALFECDFGGKNQRFFAESVKIGSDMKATGWTYYPFVGDKLGAFLSSGLGLRGITNSQSIKIIYTDKVWARDPFVVVEDSQGIHQLSLDAQLGRCE